jgi:diguanylate cyclase (GGDEF)-like protein
MSLASAGELEITMDTVETFERSTRSGAGPHPCEPKSVLVAEDDPISRHILEVILRNWGYQVTAMDNGFKALEILAGEKSPELLLLDWMMPGIDGVELCRRIRALNKPVYPYILLLTARDAKQDLVTGLEAGADDYLTKPFNAEELRARLRAGGRILALQSELIHAREQLRFHATHDVLTGTWNRKGILDLLSHELARARRAHESVGLMMIDLDHFKAVNDTHGHATGDEVLKEVAARLVRSVRTYDLVGRYGGEEFLVILSNASIEEVRRRAERLCAVVQETPVRFQSLEVKVTVSVGATEAPPDQEILQSRLVDIADLALYQAKNRGRNRVETRLYAI